MPKLIIYLKPKFEEYDVKVYIYSQEGRLLEEKNFEKIKQIVIRAGEVRISRQLFHEHQALIMDTQNPRIEVGEGLLYISSE